MIWALEAFAITGGISSTISQSERRALWLASLANFLAAGAYLAQYRETHNAIAYAAIGISITAALRLFYVLLCETPMDRLIGSLLITVGGVGVMLNLHADWAGLAIGGAALLCGSFGTTSHRAEWGAVSTTCLLVLSFLAGVYAFAIMNLGVLAYKMYRL